MLCYTCLALFRNRYWSHLRDHHYSVRALQRAALEGCYICRVLWNGTSDAMPTFPHAMVEVAIIEEESTHGEPISTCAIVNQKDRGENFLDLYFTVNQKGVSSAAKAFGFRMQPLRDARDILSMDDVYDLSDWASSMTCARWWLSKCEKSHSRCQTSLSTETTQFAPTRLLEIGQPFPDQVRLRLFPSRKSTGIRYATLSHCWGASDVLRLTSSSAPRLEKGIKIAELAQTFQDAIFTARLLNIQFLWIDSLCILQDSHKDWQQEASLMSYVYKNAILNIAASAAGDSNASCFHERDASSIEPCIVQTVWTDAYNDTYHMYHTNFWHSTLKDTPLAKRAWVVQELLLAPRVLHLSGRQLFWECYELSACETYPAGLPSMYQPGWISGDARWQAFNDVATQYSKDTLMKLWTAIVATYTKCDLTYTTDKLIALSGIAKLMQKALDDEYCAGLWKNHFVAELSWYSPKSSKRSSMRSITYRAPSWSWASLDGGIFQQGHYHIGDNTVPLVTIIKCDIKPATDDWTGAILGGSLNISGWLMSLQIHPHPDPQKGWRIFFNEQWWEHGPKFTIRFDYTDDFSTTEIHWLPLYADRYTISRSRITSITGLLLSPTESSKGQFQRIGYFRADLQAFGLEHWMEFVNVTNESWMQYETMSEGKYVVSII